jgi:hypothetical protein
MSKPPTTQPLIAIRNDQYDHQDLDTKGDESRVIDQRLIFMIIMLVAWR